MATAHIKLNLLNHNLKQIRTHLKPSTQILTAVKANAYGHGSVEIAKHLESQNINWFGVATASEALTLRESGINANILIFAPEYTKLEKVLENDISLCIADQHSLNAITRVTTSKKARVHLKLDTGMGRLGLGRKEALELAKTIDANKRLIFEGVWTHFAASDDEDRAFTECQLEAFHLFLVSLQQEGIEPKLKHASNSAAIFAYPDAQFDMVRPGIAVYGYHSSPFIASLEPNLEPALELTAPITFVKRVKAGTSISYSSLWHASKDTTIATVRIGYADGYARSLTGKAQVLIQNQLRPIAGRVCMDQMMIDVGDLDVKIGDTVSLFGTPSLNAEDLAASINTISYELLTSLSERVTRVYF